MKKIFFYLLTACALVACNPVHEDFSNDGNITVEELIEKTTVTVDRTDDGKFGNVVTCSTSAAVNAKWYFDGDSAKSMLGNYAWKKMKLGEHYVTLSALCADGTWLKAEFPVKCEVITQELKKYPIYEGEPLVLGPGDAAAGRFSDNEGKGLPYLSDDVYWGFKTLVFEVLEANPADGGIWGEPAGPTMVRIMNGWWAATYADEVIIDGPGLWELPITEEIAKDCARGNGGDGKDLDILVRRGSLKIGSVYYEE